MLQSTTRMFVIYRIPVFSRYIAPLNSRQFSLQSSVLQSKSNFKLSASFSSINAQSIQRIESTSISTRKKDLHADNFVSIIKLMGTWLSGTIKACLPYGILPRKKVAGQNVLITGSATGIGRLMALEFGRLGANLILWDVNTPENEVTKRLLEREGSRAHTFTVDLTKLEQIKTAADKVQTNIGDIDILINNAGVVTGKKFLDSDPNEMKFVLDVNLYAIHYVTRLFMPRMIQRDHGHVVTVASIAGHLTIAGLVDYCASKHGAVGFSKALADEVRISGRKGVNVTTICPFYIDTGMFEGVGRSMPKVFPLLKPQLVVDRTMEAILTNRDMLIIPRLGYLTVALFSILPSETQFRIARLLGVHETMNHFIGRK